MTNTTTVTVNIPTDILEKIKALAVLRNRTVTETIVRSLCDELYLHERVSSGHRVLVKSQTGEMKQLVFNWTD